MKFLTDKTVKVSRILMFVVTLFCIPFLLASFLLEGAFGGTVIIKYVILPLVCILTYFAYILYKRWNDKNKRVQSKKYHIISELTIGLTALIITCLTMYAMLTAGFEVDVFIVLLGLIFISLTLSFNSLIELKII